MNEEINARFKKAKNIFSTVQTKKTGKHLDSVMNNENFYSLFHLAMESLRVKPCTS